MCSQGVENDALCAINTGRLCISCSLFVRLRRVVPVPVGGVGREEPNAVDIDTGANVGAAAAAAAAVENEEASSPITDNGIL